jgi:hypothetical protein
MAHRDASLRRTDWVAIGGVADMPGALRTAHATRLTQNGQSKANFAVVHNGHHDVVVYDRRPSGGRGETASHYDP